MLQISLKEAMTEVLYFICKQSCPRLRLGLLTIIFAPCDGNLFPVPLGHDSCCRHPLPSDLKVPIISVWHESRYKPGLEVEDAKWLVRDAIAARIFNDMVSLERKSSNETSSPFPPPYAKLKLEKNYVVCGLGGGVGHVWLWRKPHKCKCDLRLLSMILQCS